MNNADGEMMASKNTEILVSMANMFWNSRTDAERKLINFLFVMNGAGIVGTLTFLGAIHDKLNLPMLIFISCGLITLISGIIIATFLMIRVMLISAGIGNSLYNAAVKSLQSNDFHMVLEEHNQFLGSLGLSEPPKDKKLVTWAYVLFCTSVGFVLNGILYITLSGYWWAIVLLASLVTSIAVKVVIGKVFN